MADNALIFLPDISGFTNFVHNTANEHSKHIIAELLEILIDTNALDLTLAEIEGDAIFYYKDKQLPSPTELLAQVQTMFVTFHEHLKQYEKNRICNCGACSTASQLTVKFIAHAGPLEFITIKKMQKPYGQTVIAAHRLMKNEVPSDEYLLLSDDLIQSWEQPPAHEDLAPVMGQSEYDLGMVKYQYFLLDPLMKHVREPKPLPSPSPTNKLASVHGKVPLPTDQLYALVSDFKHRKSWNKEINRLEYEEGKINQIGTKHLCVVDQQLINFETIVVPADDKETIVYGERTNDMPFFKEMITYFLIKQEGNQSQITIEIHTSDRSFLARIMAKFASRIIKKKIKGTLQELQDVAQKIAAVEVL